MMPSNGGIVSPTGFIFLADGPSPEIVRFPKDARLYSAQEVADMLGNSETVLFTVKMGTPNSVIEAIRAEFKCKVGT